jgi:peptidoglycan/LPS O-acetylase OafA/YrhL
MLATLFAFWTANPIADFAIWVVIFVCIAGLVLLYCQYAGWNPPPWFWRAIGLVVGAVIIIMLIVFIASFAGRPGPVFSP